VGRLRQECGRTAVAGKESPHHRRSARALDGATPALLAATSRIALQRGARDGGLTPQFYNLFSQVQSSAHAMTSGAAADAVAALPANVAALLDVAGQFEQGAEADARDAFAQARAAIAPALTALSRRPWKNRPNSMLPARQLRCWSAVPPRWVR
jgi:hypothetical protein